MIADRTPLPSLLPLGRSTLPFGLALHAMGKGFKAPKIGWLRFWFPKLAKRLGRGSR